MNEQKQRFTPTKMSELMGKSFPPLEWLVDGLVPMGDITVIGGYPGSFKTWLMLDIAVSSAQGRDFLGRFKTRKEKILIIDEESCERGLQRRLSLLTDEKDLDIEILSYSGFDISKTDWAVNYCLENGIKVVMIDSLIRIHKLKDENSSAEMAKIFAEFKKFKQNNITLIALHHNRKSGSNNSDSGEDMRGSSEIFASLDCALSLKKNNNSEIIIRQTKLKEDEERSPFLVKVIKDNNSTSFEFLGDIKEEERKSKPDQARERLLGVLTEKGELWRQELLPELSDCTAYAINTAIKQLSNEGKINIEKGKGSAVLYSLV